LADPCTFTTTAAMSIMHEVIMGLGGASLVINVFMVRLMWADYKKRHHINGDS
jgi:hypothetical protein